MPKVSKKKKVNLEEYVHQDTGNYLSDTHPNITSVNIVNNDLHLITYKNYFIVSDEALDYISDKFNDPDMGKIYKLSRMVEGNFNIIMNKIKQPHDKESLRIDLDYSVNKFTDFLAKLFLHGVIGYIITMKNRRKHTVIILNPHLARKRKTIHKDTMEYFDKHPLREIK